LESSAVDQLIHFPQLGLLAILYMRLHDEKTKVSKKIRAFLRAVPVIWKSEDGTI
jgi:hypothetical protein